jgi:hypothetical protein
VSHTHFFKDRVATNANLDNYDDLINLKKHIQNIINIIELVIQKSVVLARFPHMPGYGIISLNLTPSLAFTISMLGSSFILTLVFQLKRTRLSFSSSTNKKMKAL